MEEVKLFLHQVSENSWDSSSDSGDDADILRSGALLKRADLSAGEYSGMCKNNSEVRLPTRRPDPNVYNRNALLARENRQKKKAYVATIEKELQEVHLANRTLSKVLKKQIKKNNRLKKEKQYFRSIVKNRTEIMTLISALNTRLENVNGPKMQVTQTPLTPASSLGSIRRESRCCSSYDPEALSISFDNSENDLESPGALKDSWDELLNNDFELGQQERSEIEIESMPIHNINNDHSYVNPDAALNISSNDLGVCLHITRGKVSLEFCPTCHWNACSSPPSQLLQSDAATDENAVWSEADLFVSMPMYGCLTKKLGLGYKAYNYCFGSVGVEGYSKLYRSFKYIAARLDI